VGVRRPKPRGAGWLDTLDSGELLRRLEAEEGSVPGTRRPRVPADLSRRVLELNEVRRLVCFLL